MSNDTHHNTQTTHQLTLRGGKRTKTYRYELSIVKNDDGDWKIVKFFDHEVATPYLHTVGSAALKARRFMPHNTLSDGTWRTL